MPCCPTATVHMEPFSISAHSARRLLFGVYIGQHPNQFSCSRYDLISQTPTTWGPYSGYTYIHMEPCDLHFSRRGLLFGVYILKVYNIGGQSKSAEQATNVQVLQFTWSPSSFQPKVPTIWGLCIKSLQYWRSIYSEPRQLAGQIDVLL